MFEGFMSFGGTEVINSSRTAAYVEHMLPNFGLDNCYDCGDLQHALGHEDYTSPLVDGADWFDSDDVASQQFFGLYPLSVDGIDDAVRESTVTQLAGDGAVMSAPRQRGREIRVTGLLIGMDDAAVAYGLTWLRAALFGGACRDSTSCTGDHLCYFSSCPPICEDSPDVAAFTHERRLCDEGIISSVARACALPFERNLYEVTVIDGPRVVERYNTVCGSMVRIEFSMVAGVPWSYSTAAWVASSVEGQTSQVIPEISCNAGSTSVLRRNLAPNPVPLTAGGWTAAEPAGYAVTRDNTFSRLPGRASAKVTVTNAEALANIAPNPVPTANLDGWEYSLGSADPTVRTNLALNPRPGAAAGGWFFNQGTALADGRNWFPNPGITTTLTGWDVAQWGLDSTGHVVHDASGGAFTDQQPSGIMRMIWDTSVATGDVAMMGWDPVGPTVAGEAHHAYASFRTTAAVGTTNVLVRLVERDPVGAVVATVDSPAITLVPGMWHRQGTVLVPAAAANTIEATAIFGGQIIAGTEMEISNFSQGDAGAGYFDGDTPDFDTAISYTWQGAPGASVSVRTVAAPAGSIALDAAGVGPNGLAGFYRRTTTVPETSGTDRSFWRYRPASGPTWTAGEAVTVSVYVRSSVARALAVSAVIAGRSAVAAGTRVSMPANTWTRLFVTLTVETSGTGIITVETQYPPGEFDVSGTLDITQLLVEESASLLSYFDGSSPDTPAIDHAWTGTANNSTSTLVNKAPTAFTVLDTGAGPNAINGFQRTTITVPKSAGYSGGFYEMAATSSPIYTAAIFVRFSVQTTARLILQGRDAGGAVVVSAGTAMQGIAADTWVRLGPLTINRASLASVRVWAQQDPATVLAVGDTMDVAQVVVAPDATLGSPSMGRVLYVGQAATGNVIAVMPTVEYTASIYVATSRPSHARAVVAFRDTAGVVLGTGTGTWGPTASQTWSRVQVSATAPAGTTFATIEAQSNLLDQEGQVGDATWWGDVLLERSSVALAYFDGSLPDTPAIDHAWTGTANNSISTLSRTIAVDPGPVLDPDCAVVPQAPRPPILDIACLDTPAAWRRYTAILPEDVVPMWRDAVPIVRVATDDVAARQVRVRFYANPFSVPVEALDPCEFCGEFVISYIPPNSIMSIDGIRQNATVSGPTGVVQVASHLLYASDGGPMVWPLLTCGISYTITVDVSPEGVTGLSAEICAAARE